MPEKKYYLPRVDAACAAPGCPNWAEEGDLCAPHAWSAEHPGETYDPFDHFRHPDDANTSAVFPHFPKSTTDQTKITPRSASSMGQGKHTPAMEDDPTCRSCGTPQHREDGEREEIDVFDKDGRRSTAYKSIEETCENKESHERRGVPLKPDWPSGYPVIYDAPDDFDPDDDENADEDEKQEPEEVSESEDDWQPQDLKDLWRLYAEQDEREDNDSNEPEDDEDDDAEERE